MSSTAKEPAPIFANGFGGIDNYKCSLSIPTTSFTKYLLAEYWGAFVDIRNNIEVSVDKNIDITYIDEADYEEIMEEQYENLASHAGGWHSIGNKRLWTTLRWW